MRKKNKIIKKEKRVEGEKPRFFSSKGFVEGVPWTAIVLIITVISVIALIAVMTFFLLPFTPGKPFSFDITFVDLINRPYLVASSVGNAKFLDRTFFEHALEAAVVEGLENSNSEPIIVLVEDYLDFYDLTYFSISVKKKDKKIFEINNLPKKCGVEAYCTPEFFRSEAGVCNAMLGALKQTAYVIQVYAAKRIKMLMKTVLRALGLSRAAKTVLAYALQSSICRVF